MKIVGDKEGMVEVLAVIPTMDVVVFPNMIVPLLVLDEKIIRGVNQAIDESKNVLLLAAKGQVDTQGSIGTNDLYQIGTVATVMRTIKVPEGGMKVLVQGIGRARATDLIIHGDMLQAHITMLPVGQDDSAEIVAQVKNIKSLAEKMVETGHAFSPDFHIILSKIQDPDKVADFILSHITLSVDQAQILLEADSQKDFLSGLYSHLLREVEVAQLQEKIKSGARDAMNKSQKEFYLREQLKVIKQELGENDLEDIEEMRAKLASMNLPEDVTAEVNRQMSRLERTSPDSLESTVTRNYLEWIFALPWGVYTEDNLDINHARAVLDEDHFGLRDIKERILDFISIRTLKQDGFAPILCFVGPPGTGKTSLGQSIARSLNRAYVRISLGGVKDESEIRGHRRTYVGSLPGRFIQGIRKAGSCNPVMVIDELDKIGSDFRGDPAAAMLEVLDPQQNKTFYDNYLGVPFDLSRVMFIATANSLDTISGPLRDRMEVIELSGYSTEEKINIANKHLVRKALVDTGMHNHGLTISKDVLEAIVFGHTRESGVRQLERMIKKLCSKAARSWVESQQLLSLSLDSLPALLGPAKFMEDDIDFRNEIGISNGLAWTVYGGEMLKIEAVLIPGKGKLILTGQLGSVMKESAQAALSYARIHAREFNIDQRIFNMHDIHIHVPAGAIPKDGPSAGITMLTAIISALTKRPIDAGYAMTGELNLRGHVMPIGGVKEKILAAIRNRKEHVIFPHKNKNDLCGIEEVAEGIDIVWVDHADEVIERVLLSTAGEIKAGKNMKVR